MWPTYSLYIYYVLDNLLTNPCTPKLRLLRLLHLKLRVLLVARHPPPICAASQGPHADRRLQRHRVRGARVAGQRRAGDSVLYTVVMGAG